MKETTHGGIPAGADKVRRVKIREEAIREESVRIRPINSLQKRDICQEPGKRVAQTAIIQTPSQTPAISTQTPKASRGTQQHRCAKLKQQHKPDLILVPLIPQTLGQEPDTIDSQEHSSPSHDANPEPTYASPASIQLEPLAQQTFAPG